MKVRQEKQKRGKEQIEQRKKENKECIQKKEQELSKKFYEHMNQMRDSRMKSSKFGDSLS